MAMRGDIDHTAEFWSKNAKEWRPLAGIVCDAYPTRVVDMKAAGITAAKILGSGEEDCPACVALIGKIYAIDEVPSLPPNGCTCVPWCRCIEVGLEGD